MVQKYTMPVNLQEDAREISILINVRVQTEPAMLEEIIETELYDGEYFIQKIQFSGLKAEDPTTVKSFGGEYSKEAKELLEKEGPKYQYGKGCLSDGVLGAWIGRMCGLEDTIDAAKIKSHLKAVHKYNLKKNLSEHAKSSTACICFR
jgi:uncharacterized protein (DUF608 family)